MWQYEKLSVQIRPLDTLACFWDVKQLANPANHFNHTSDLKIGSPVATLPDAWRCRVSAKTGWYGVSTLYLGEIVSLSCNVYLSVAACQISKQNYP